MSRFSPQNRSNQPSNGPKIAPRAAKRFEIKAANAAGKKMADVWLYDDIGENPWSGGGVGAKQFADELTALGPVDTIRCYVNSQGGDVFEGLAIYNILQRHKATKEVHVDGIAASIASVICMAGDEITMAQNAFMMIHNPWTMGMGNADQFREMAAQLDKVGGELADTYARRSGMPLSKISDLMAAETWMTADEAVANGFADGTARQPAIAASLDLNRFKNAPATLARGSATPANPGQGSLRDRIAANLRFVRNVNNDLPPGSPDLPPQTSESGAPAPAPEIVKPHPESDDMTPAEMAISACHDVIEQGHKAIHTSAGKPDMHGPMVSAMHCADTCHAAMAMMLRKPDDTDEDLINAAINSCYDAGQKCAASGNLSEMADACTNAVKMLTAYKES